jgi:hypothetical protein
LNRWLINLINALNIIPILTQAGLWDGALEILRTINISFSIYGVYKKCNFQINPASI